MKSDIAKFVELTISETGLVNLVLDFPQDQNSTKVDFHISELRDWLDTNDDIVDICIIKDEKLYNCIELSTKDGHKERIYEDDDFFFTDFLNLDIE